MPQPTGLIFRLMNSVITTTIWLGFLSVLVELNDRYKRKYLALSSQLIITRMAAEDEREKSFERIADEISRFQISLRKLYLMASQHPNSHEVAQSTSDAILKDIEVELKPLTRKMWERSINSTPRFRFWSLIKISILDFQMNSFLQSSLLFLTSMINYTAAFDLITALKVSVLGTLLLLVSAEAHKRVMCRYPKKSAEINIFYVSVIGFIVMYVPLESILMTGFLTMLPYVSLLGLFLTFILISFSMLKHVTTARSTILTRLVEEISLNKKRGVSYGEQSRLGDLQLASYLHNSLQSELTSIAYELGEVARDPSEIRLRTVMDRFSDLIERSLELDFLDYIESPRERYQKIIDSWSSIVEIKLDVDETIFEDSSRVSLFVQLVQEALANSVRSGQANWVAINAHYDDGVLKVEIIDDGEKSNSGAIGIGKSWISSVSFSSWTLDNSKDGSKLTVDF